MNKLLLTIILLSSPFSYASIINFSGSITVSPCKVIITKDQIISYNNTKKCVPIFKTTEKIINRDIKKV